MNKNVIVTGASRGIGRGIVQAFAQNQDNVWACVRRDNREFLEQTDCRRNMESGLR